MVLVEDEELQDIHNILQYPEGYPWDSILKGITLYSVFCTKLQDTHRRLVNLPLVCHSTNGTVLNRSTTHCSNMVFILEHISNVL